MIARLDNKIAIEIPLSCNEITFKQFKDIQQAEQALFSLNDKEISTEEKAVLQVSIITDLVMNICGKMCEFIDFDTQADKQSNLIETRFRFQIGQKQEVSIMRLWAHLINTIEAYEIVPSSYAFETTFKGETYYVTSDRALRIAGIGSRTAGEVIEALELRRTHKAAISQKGDPDGNLAFKLGCYEMAVLLRKDNESIPVIRSERVKFINTRAELFQDLPLDTVLSIRFFLISIYKIATMTATSNMPLKEKNRVITGLLRSKKDSGTRTVELRPKVSDPSKSQAGGHGITWLFRKIGSGFHLPHSMPFFMLILSSFVNL